MDGRRWAEPSKVGGASSRRVDLPLRVLPDPDSAAGRAEALAAAWARDAEQDDWCIDAAAVLSAGCAQTDTGQATMPARERRAVHLTRQRIRAQAVLAAAADSAAGPAHRRLRSWAILAGSVALHLLGFVVLASTVADLRGKPKSSEHEPFEAAIVVPIELHDPAELAPVELELPTPEPTLAAQPRERPVTSRPRPRPSSPSPASHDPPQPSAAGQVQQLHGFEFSSEGGRASEAGGSRFASPGGSGSGSGSGSGGSGSGSGGSGSGGAAPVDVAASPRGKLLEPEYPADLERLGVEGSVLVKVWIDEHGHVIKAEVVESSGHEGFDHNALMTAQRQDWTPAEQGGEPVASTRRYRVHFRLR